MKRILAMILVAVLLFTAALPGLAASGTQHGQTQEMQSAAILSEPGGSYGLMKNIGGFFFLLSVFTGLVQTAQAANLRAIFLCNRLKSSRFSGIIINRIFCSASKPETEAG